MEGNITEEEVRTKVVYEWLRCRGIQERQIQIERKVVFQVGHGQSDSKRFGRYDLLVQSKAGKNLILFEVKAPGIKITHDAIDQAVSYARILKGNMAPIVVVTNGTECEVYNSLTKENIGFIDISNIMSGGFHYAGNEYEMIKSEAISTLAKDSLFINYICMELSRTEIERLSGDISSAKKHCNELYVSLGVEYDGCYDVLLVSGPPQSGKTNFLCHVFNELMLKGRNALFMRASTVRNGIVQHLKHSLVSYLNIASDASTVDDVTCKILAGKNIVIFIDGLNEVKRLERDDIISEIERIIRQKVCFVLSCTDSFVRTIKTDCNNNHVNLFKLNREDLSFSELKIPMLDDKKYSEVIAHYQAAYKIRLNPRQRLSSINAIGKFYHLISVGYSVDELDSEYKVLEVILEDKCRIISEIEECDCKDALLFLAKNMASSTSRVKASFFSKALTGREFSALPDAFKVHGVLEVIDGFVEFYDETYRDILLIQDCHHNYDADSVIKVISEYPNKDIGDTCLFKYLCFYNIPASHIFHMDLTVQIRMIDAFISYIDSCELANSHIINMLLDLVVNGINNGEMQAEKAESVLTYIGEVCTRQDDIRVSYVKTQYILGYCTDSLDFSSMFDFKEHPEGFYCGNYSSFSFYNYLGELINDYFIEGNRDVFNKEYEYEITRAVSLYGSECLKALGVFYFKLMGHILNYDSYMCSFGSYISILVNDFRETGADDELKTILDILLDLKSLLSQSHLFDDFINEIKSEMNI
ncbi:type I restriction enzyme HsdR N-terminal domain-containing protein [Aeromonas allosaccharophila]